MQTIIQHDGLKPSIGDGRSRVQAYFCPVMSRWTAGIWNGQGTLLLMTKVGWRLSNHLQKLGQPDAFISGCN